MLLCLSCVSASDINQTTQTASADLDVSAADDNSAVLKSSDENALGSNSSEVIPTTYKTTSGSLFNKNDRFTFQLLDENGAGIANKSIQLTFSNKVSNFTTNAKGEVSYKLFARGNHVISFLFDEDGYAPVSVSKKVTIIDTSKTTLKGSNYVAYVGADNPFTVTLSAAGVVLPDQKVKITIVGKTYTATTNANGKASLKINLAKPNTYPVKYSFSATKMLKASSGSAKITVKKGMPTSIVRMNSITYKHQTSDPFIVKYKDVRGNPLAYKTLVFKINKKTYTKKTDKNGMAQIDIKLNKGSYTLTVDSYNTAVYKKSSNSYTVKVKSDTVLNNGFWLFGSDMKKVNLKTMADYGVNQIFLNSYAVTLYGKSAVSNFATQAKSLGINVHIWMQVFNDGNWIAAVNKDGSLKYSLYNSIINDAKDYAKINGVAGIHFDYLRFPGTAYKYKNAVEAINYFTKQACDALHKQSSSIIVSAAVMPEPNSMKYYYGQDIPTMSKYLDVIVPMIYKGNYGASSSWIKTTTEAFIKMSNGAQVWSGLQGYYSDSNVKKLPVSSMKKDADNAIAGGASGVIVFRYSLFNLIDFAAL